MQYTTDHLHLYFMQKFCFNLILLRRFWVLFKLDLITLLALIIRLLYHLLRSHYCHETQHLASILITGNNNTTPTWHPTWYPNWHPSSTHLSANEGSKDKQSVLTVGDWRDSQTIFGGTKRTGIQTLVNLCQRTFVCLRWTFIELFLLPSRAGKTDLTIELRFVEIRSSGSRMVLELTTIRDKTS